MKHSGWMRAMHWVSCASLVVSALAGSPRAAHAFCRTTTSLRPQVQGTCQPDGKPLFWKRRCSSYAVHVAGSRSITVDRLRAVFEEAFDSWENVDCGGGVRTGLKVDVISEPALCDAAEFNRDGSNVQSVAFVTDWTDRGYPANAFAVTTTWHNASTGEILDVDMELNEARPQPYAECPAAGCCPDSDVCSPARPPVCADLRIDLLEVATHEVGHYFGIAHSDQCLATMYYAAPVGAVNKRTLEDDDKQAICAAYPPGSLDLNVCKPAPIGGLNTACATSDGGGATRCMAGATPDSPYYCAPRLGAGGCCHVGPRQDLTHRTLALLGFVVIGMLLTRRFLRR